MDCDNQWTRDLCTCVSEEHRDGDGAGVEELSRLSYVRIHVNDDDFITAGSKRREPGGKMSR